MSLKSLRIAVSSVCTGVNINIEGLSAKQYLENLVSGFGEFLDFAMFMQVVPKSHPDYKQYHKLFAEQLKAKTLEQGDSVLYYCDISRLYKSVDELMASPASVEYGYVNYLHLAKEKYDKRKFPRTADPQRFVGHVIDPGYKHYTIGSDSFNGTNEMNLENM